jgi:GH24 family phage-related lysozyme (muramidase)
MAVVEKGNVVLDIRDSEIEHYLDMGYNVTDGNGTVIKACVPKDIGTLQKVYSEQLLKIEELEATITKLKKENVKLKNGQK